MQAWLIAIVSRLVFPAQLRHQPIRKFGDSADDHGGLIFGVIGALLPLTLFSGEKELEVIIEHSAEIGLVMLLVLLAVKLFTLSVCMQTGFPGGFIFPILFSAGALGAAINLLFPFIPLTVSMLCVMAGVGGALMRLPFSTILLLSLLTMPNFGPFLIVSALTGFLTATFVQAGNARRAYQETEAQQRKTVKKDVAVRQQPASS